MKQKQHRGKMRTAILVGNTLLAGIVAAQVDIADKPLFVTAGVEPNIITAIDDSGSMDGEVLMPTNDGALWWRTGSHASFVGLDGNDNAATGVLNFNRAGGANGSWKKYVYLFPNGTGNGNRVYRDRNNDHYAIPPFAQFAFVRSPAYNGLYYDYRLEYKPWPDAGGRNFPDVDPGSAPSDPVIGSGTFDLTKEHRDTGNHWRFRFHSDMVIPEGTEYRDGSWIAASSDTVWNGGDDSVPVEYYPATYYERVSDNISYTVEDDLGNTLSGSCDTPNPAHYEQFERFPSTLVGTGIDALAYDGGCLRRHEIRPGESFPSGRSYDDEMQNFANWFSYSRKRHIAPAAASARVSGASRACAPAR